MRHPSKQMTRGMMSARRGAFVHHELPTPPKGIPVYRVATEPGPDGLYRDCVIREPHNDLMGRPIFVALNADACELDRSVAVSREQTEKLIERLWQIVERAREHSLQIVR